MPVVSIILPVFNGERFLQNAINSVLQQSCKDWELFIIDDGSTDNSPAICDEYSSTDTRITVFHQANQGVNAARATGIVNATGSFLTFLDADDALLPNAIDYMSNLFREGIDLVANGQFLGLSSREDYVKTLWKGETGPELWGKMFRTSLFKPIANSLEKRMVMGEDLLLNSIYALHIEAAYLFPQAVYDVNRENQTSVTRTFKHNWEYEKYFFSKVDELFLSKCTDWNSYEAVRLLVNKSWLNAMKYVLLDGSSIDYGDAEFKTVEAYFRDKKDELGPSEKMLLSIKIPWLYRILLQFYLKLK